MNRKWGWLLVLVLHGQPAWSGTMLLTGNELLESCQAWALNDGDRGKAATCTSYVKGIVDMHALLVSKGIMMEQWCLPGDVTVDKLAQITLDYVTAQPDRLDASAGAMVANALYKAYHCH